MIVPFQDVRMSMVSDKITVLKVQDLFPQGYYPNVHYYCSD